MLTLQGSDAMEAAIKLARQYHYEKGNISRVRFLARENSYHGNTIGTLAIGGHVQRREIFEPLLIRNTSHVSACNPYRDRNGLTDAQYVAIKAQELEEEFDKFPNEIIAFIVEPVAGAVCYAATIANDRLCDAGTWLRSCSAWILGRHGSCVQAPWCIADLR